MWLNPSVVDRGNALVTAEKKQAGANQTKQQSHQPQSHQDATQAKQKPVMAEVGHGDRVQQYPAVATVMPQGMPIQSGAVMAAGGAAVQGGVAAGMSIGGGLVLPSGGSMPGVNPGIPYLIPVQQADGQQVYTVAYAPGPAQALAPTQRMASAELVATTGHPSHHAEERTQAQRRASPQSSSQAPTQKSPQAASQPREHHHHAQPQQQPPQPPQPQLAQAVASVAHPSGLTMLASSGASAPQAQLGPTSLASNQAVYVMPQAAGGFGAVAHPHMASAAVSGQGGYPVVMMYGAPPGASTSMPPHQIASAPRDVASGMSTAVQTRPSAQRGSDVVAGTAAAAAAAAGSTAVGVVQVPGGYLASTVPVTTASAAGSQQFVTPYQAQVAVDGRQPVNQASSVSGYVAMPVPGAPGPAVYQAPLKVSGYLGDNASEGKQGKH